MYLLIVQLLLKIIKWLYICTLNILGSENTTGQEKTNLFHPPMPMQILGAYSEQTQSSPQAGPEQAQGEP